MPTNRLTISTKLYILLGAVSATMLAYALWSWFTLSMASVNGPYVSRLLQGKDLVADVLSPKNYIIESYLTALLMADEVSLGVPSDVLRERVDRCRVLKDEFDQRHEYWMRNLPEGPLRTVKTEQAYQPAVQFYEVLFNEFVLACINGDLKTTESLLQGPLRSHYEQHRKAVQQVATMAEAETAVTEADASSAVAWRFSLSLVGCASMIAGCWVFGWLMRRQIGDSLGRAARKLQDVGSRELSQVAGRVKSTAENTSGRATAVTGAAEQVSANARSLSSAVEQFDTSIKEISGNASNAAAVARGAVDAANETSTTISRLAESSNEIGDVIRVINSIAEQTNLLALNATIEAARAGEAGKGFAVVANEVKELARQTSDATEQIISRIETIQSATDQATEAISRVSNIIGEISETQNAIASAVEEQALMTDEITHNITEVASGSDEIATGIAQVAESASVTVENTSDTLKTSSEIESIALGLLELVNPLRTDDPGARRESESGPEVPIPRGKYQIPEGAGTN